MEHLVAVRVIVVDMIASVLKWANNIVNAIDKRMDIMLGEVVEVMSYATEAENTVDIMIEDLMGVRERMGSPE